MRMRSACLFVFLLLVQCWCAAEELDATEGDAVEKLLLLFPSLAVVSPVDAWSEGRGYIGGSWVNTTFSTICPDGEGWWMHGVYCSSGGAVTALLFTDAWGPKANGTFEGVDGLQSLKNFSFEHAPYHEADGVALLEYLLNYLTVQHVDLSQLVLEQAPTSGINNSPSLISLNVKGLRPSNEINFETLGSLQHLVVEFSEDGNLTATFGAVAGSLKTLVLSHQDHFDYSEFFSTFHVLESLTLTCKNDSIIGGSFVAPQALRDLHFKSQTFANLSLESPYGTLESLVISDSRDLKILIELPNSLKHLKVTDGYSLTQIMMLPSSLEEFDVEAQLQDYPGGVGNCDNMRRFSLSNFFNPGGPHFSGIELHWANLTHLSFNLLKLESTPLANILCSLPNFDSLISFELSGNSQIDMPFTLPACLSNFTNLKTVAFTQVKAGEHFMDNLPVTIDSLTVQNWVGLEISFAFNWTHLVTRFPLLRELTIRSTDSDSPTFPTMLTDLQHLEKLDLSYLGLTGTIPASFFESFPNLKSIDLTANHLSGDIPNTGWHSLETVNLISNQFSMWRGITGASPSSSVPLRIINVGNNDLTDIPTDNDWNKATGLKEVKIFENQNLGGPIPFFWADHPTIESIWLYNCAFEGRLPLLVQSPSLRDVQLQGNSLCGPLFNIDLNTVGFTNLDLSSNHLSGSYPDSWLNLNLHGLLYLSSNYLNGTLPSSWFLSARSKEVMIGIDISGNDFSGPVPDLENSKLDFFHIGSTSLDPCLRNPNANNVTHCIIDGTSGGSACSCQSFWPCLWPGDCTTASPDSPSQPSVPIHSPTALPYCNQLPPRGAALPTGNSPAQIPLACGTPPSGLSLLTCVNGVWFYTGLLDTTSLHLPSRATLVINGTLRVDDPIVFEGLESEIIVHGCIYLNSPTIEVIIAQEDLEQLKKEKELSKTFISSTNGNDCPGSTDLSQVQVGTKYTAKKGCRKVKTNNSGSTRDSLNVAFKVDNSTCNMVIIIPTVIGGVLIITAVIAITVTMLKRRNHMQAQKSLKR